MYPLLVAAHVDYEIMRILQAMGCAYECAGEMRENLGMDFLNADRELLLRFDSPGLGPSSWPSSMLSSNRASTGRPVRRPRSMRVRAGEIGARDHIPRRSRCSLGRRACHGARSFVRLRSVSSSTSWRFEESWLVVDLVLDADQHQLPDRGGPSLRPVTVPTRWYPCPPAGSASSSRPLPRPGPGRHPTTGAGEGATDLVDRSELGRGRTRCGIRVPWPHREAVATRSRVARR